jgi:pimeloyl-ACP methyl ester carboxylesterase
VKPPLLELGGTGPVLHLALANGFPPATYEPLFVRLRDRFRIVCLSPRALWVGGGPPPAEAGSWESLADDLLAGWESHRLSPLVALGHSFGAVASLLAAVRSPASVAALIMLDPTIMPRELMSGYAAELAAGRSPRLRLVDTALKRRSRFGSLQEAFEYWRGKDLFRDWPDQALERYASAMLRPNPAGGWTLVWPPEWEAWYYRSFYPHTWDIVPQLDPAIPALVVGGEASDTFVTRSSDELRKLMPGATFATIPGAGHLFPQSHPAETRAVIEPWLASIVRQPRLSVS